MNKADGEKLLALYRPDLMPILEDSADYRKRQVLAHLLRPGLTSFVEATSLPAGLRTELDAVGASTLRPVERRTSTDGTTKLLHLCRDDSQVETVVMPYRDRTTACISSQIGCPVGCTFCATGASGFTRNLSPAEIVDQVRSAASVSSEIGARLSNIVYMGMGEPLLNLRSVLDSIKILTDQWGMGFGRRSLSVSTVGIPTGIVRLAKEEPQVNLALSLHAASDEVRRSLIPSRHRHPLDEILAAAWQHFELTRRKLFVEYVLLRGVNDSPADARRLASLLRGHVVTVNLLSWNLVEGLPGAKPVRETAGARHKAERTGAYARCSRETTRAFRDTLRSRGIEVTVRQSKGADIEGACGQLAARRRATR